VSHFSFACDLFCTLSRGLVFISNANPTCSCVYICKFQFRPIHPPSRRLSPYHQDVSRYHPEAEGDSRSSCATKSAEAGYAYCFVSFALYSRICRQPPRSFCCFGKPTPSILAAASSTTADAARTAARRESAQSPLERLQRGVRSSHSQ
jgi:hypothetical protein